MAVTGEQCRNLVVEQTMQDGDKRVAFLTVSLSGHRRLALSLASEMAARGLTVDFLVSAAGVNDELRTLACQYPKFTLHSIEKGTDLISDINWQRVASSSGRLGGSKHALFQCFAEAFKDVSGAVEHWREMIEVLKRSRPDIVVLDHAHKVLQQWAEDNGIPTVIMHTPYFQAGPPTGCADVSHEDAQKLNEFLEVSNPFKKIEQAKEELGIKGEQIDLGEAQEKVLYVAFGTLANGFLTASTVGTLLDAFASLGPRWRVLWSLPQPQQALLALSGRRLDADRVRVEPFVRQRAVLAHPAVRVFLTHAGQSSANEGIAAGCPLVCMPLFCDQYEMAEAVHRHGLGLVYHKDELLDGQAQRLRLLLLQAEGEPLFRRTAGRHAQLMRIRGGCRRAAEVVESIVHAGADFGELWQGRGTDEPERALLEPEELDDAALSTPAPARTLLQQPAAMVKRRVHAADGGESPLANGGW